MAVKTITGKLTDLSGNAIPYPRVRATLSAPAVIAATQEVAPTTLKVIGAADGTWTMLAQANADLIPANTSYNWEVGEAWSGSVIVPQTAGPFKIEDIMAPPPPLGAAWDATLMHLAGTEIVTGVKLFATWPWFTAAKGDGVTDDTTALQATIDAVKSTTVYPAADGTGGTAKVHQGVFATTATLNTTRHMTLEGQGWGTVFSSATANPILQMTADATEPGIHGATWRNFIVDGVSAANGKTGGQIVKWGTGSAPAAVTTTVDSVRFVRSHIGLRLVNTQGLSVRDCLFDYDDIGCYIADNSQIGTFETCKFRFCNTVGLLMESTSAIIGGTADQPYSWTFISCHWESNVNRGVIIDGCGYNCFLGCKWEQNGATFVTIQKVNGNAVFDNQVNTFISCLFNGNPSAPAVLQLDIQFAKNTQFFACNFNVGSTGGINLAANASHTEFRACNNASAIADAGLQTSFWNPAGGTGFIRGTAAGDLKFAGDITSARFGSTANGSLNELRFGGNGGLSYQRLSDAPSGGIYHGYNFKSASGWKHDSTGTVAGLVLDGTGARIYTDVSQAADTVVAPVLSVATNGDVTMPRGIGFWGHAAVASQPAAIASPTAPSAGYVQAEAQSMKTAVDAIRAVLSGSGLSA